jgi:hypothetical protein
VVVHAKIGKGVWAAANADHLGDRGVLQVIGAEAHHRVASADESTVICSQDPGLSGPGRVPLLRALGILLLSQRALFRGSASLHGVDVGVPAAPGRIEDARSGDADGPGDTTTADGHVRGR